MTATTAPPAATLDVRGVTVRFGGVLSTGWEEGVGFLILVLVLVLRPQGLLGRAVRRA